MTEHTESPHIVFIGQAHPLKEKASTYVKTVETHMDHLVDSSAQYIKPKAESVQNTIQTVTEKIHTNSAVIQLEKRAHEGMKTITPVINDAKQTIHRTYEHDVKPKSETILAGVKRAIEWHAPKQWEQRLITQYDTVLTHLPRDKQEVAKRIRPNIEKAVHVAGYAITGTEVAVVVAVTCGTAYAITHPTEMKRLFRGEKIKDIRPFKQSESPIRPTDTHIQDGITQSTKQTPPIHDRVSDHPKSKWSDLHEMVENCLSDASIRDIQEPMVSHRHRLESFIIRLLSKKYGDEKAFSNYLHLDVPHHTYGNPKEYIEDVFKDKEIQQLYEQAVQAASVLWKRLTDDYPRRRRVGYTTWRDPGTYSSQDVYPDDEVVRFMLDVDRVLDNIHVDEVQIRLKPLLQEISQWVKTNDYHLDKNWSSSSDTLMKRFPELADHFRIKN